LTLILKSPGVKCGNFEGKLRQVSTIDKEFPPLPLPSKNYGESTN
jgi:hypothetical protein